MDTELVSASADTERDTEAPVTDSIPEENTEDKPA